MHWLPPYANPVTGQSRIRIAAEARAHGQPFAVLVTEYAPDYLLSWLAGRGSTGVFFITTADNRLITIDPDIERTAALTERLTALSAAVTAAENMPGPRRRAAQTSISDQLDGIEADLMARLGVL